MSAAGFIPDNVQVSSTRDTHSSSTVAVAPETVLFKGKNAPIRYAESDSYFANEQCLRTPLPDSDLLKAFHCYASDFYSRSVIEEDSTDWHSMDETALLAFGILLEETGREILGDTGDLVFTEGEEIDETSNIFIRQASQAQVGNTSSIASTSTTHNKIGSTKKRRVEKQPIT